MSQLRQPTLSGKFLARGAIWNFGGLAAPLVVGLFTIPLLVSGLGTERFGLLTIMWMGVGYFSLFDMGLGRALTKLVAERLRMEDGVDLGPLIWTAIFLIFALALIGTCLILLVADPLVNHIFNIAPELKDETIVAFRLLGIGLPLVAVTSALIGLLEAHHRFATITAIRIPLGVASFIAPLISLQFTTSLVWATVALLGARLLAFGAFYAAAAAIRCEMMQPTMPVRRQMPLLFQFGGWLTVTNIVGPVMVYFDRFFIGAAMSMTAVAYYAAPYSVLSRVQVLPTSILGVLFPALASVIASDRTRLPRLYRKAVNALVLLMIPVMSGFFLLGPEALELWLGEEFRTAATPVVHWLALGWLINALARPASTVLQSAGRPDLTAKTHVLELIPYLLTLWLLIENFGIAGAAAAWFLRVLVDTLILNALVWKLFPDLGPVIRQTYLVAAGLLAGFLLAWLIESLALRFLLLATVTTVCGVGLWPTIRSLLGGGGLTSFVSLASRPTK